MSSCAIVPRASPAKSTNNPSAARWGMAASMTATFATMTMMSSKPRPPWRARFRRHHRHGRECRGHRGGHAPPGGGRVVGALRRAGAWHDRAARHQQRLPGQRTDHRLGGLAHRRSGRGYRARCRRTPVNGPRGLGYRGAERGARRDRGAHGGPFPRQDRHLPAGGRFPADPVGRSQDGCAGGLRKTGTWGNLDARRRGRVLTPVRAGRLCLSMPATKEAVIFGAGSVGRGFLGQLFCESGYRVTFVDLDRPLLEALDRRGEYKLRLVTNDSCEELTVGPVGAVHAGDLARVAEAVGRAEIGATAVGANVLKHIAPAVAAGVRRRAELGNTRPLNLIVCENLKGAAAIFRVLVRDALAAEERAFLGEHVGFVDTVIARMVPAPTPERRAQDPSLIVVEPYKELPVDAAGFIGEPPQIAGMRPYSRFSFFTERKLYVHNAGHALLAYLGYLGGYEYGYQALADEDIYYLSLIHISE